MQKQMIVRNQDIRNKKRDYIYKYNAHNFSSYVSPSDFLHSVGQYNTLGHLIDIMIKTKLHVSDQFRLVVN